MWHAGLVKKHLMPEVIRTVQTLILFNFLLRLVMEVLITAIGSSFHKYLNPYYIWKQQDLFAPKSFGIWAIISFEIGRDGSWYLGDPFVGGIIFIWVDNISFRETVENIWLNSGFVFTQSFHICPPAIIHIQSNVFCKNHSVLQFPSSFAP